MRQYETFYIIDPALEEDQRDALVERFRGIVQTNGGEIQHVDRWERRRLAYEIKGRREGYCIVMNFAGGSAIQTELDRVFRITDSVIRHLIIKLEDRVADRVLNEARAAEARARADADRAAEAAQAAEAASGAAAAAGAAANAGAQAEAVTQAEPAAQAEAAAESAAGDEAVPENGAPAAEETGSVDTGE
jgi:small subunit ribosomal protein S6